MGRHFPVREKVREFSPDWKCQGKLHKILENLANFRQILFVIFQWQLNEFVYYLLNLMEFSVQKRITEKILEIRKYWKSQGILTVRKSLSRVLIMLFVLKLYKFIRRKCNIEILSWELLAYLYLFYIVAIFCYH